MTVTESIELTLHFTIENVPGEEWHDVVLRAIGPRNKWPPPKTPKTFAEALRVGPLPLPFDALCGECQPLTRSPFMCDACTVEANVADVGPERWLTNIWVPMTEGDHVLQGHMVWRQESEDDTWTALFVATSLRARPTPTGGRYAGQAPETFLGKHVLIGFPLPDGGQEHLWVEVTGLSTVEGADLEGAIDDSPKLREDFKPRDGLVFLRNEVEDIL